MSDQRRIDHAALLRISEPATPGLCSWVAERGVGRTLEWIAAGGSIPGLEVGGLRARLSPDVGRRDLEAAARSGARLVLPCDDEWPTALADLDRLGVGSFGLYVRGTGDLGELCDRAVAIVGTRAMSDYGGYVASELGTSLVQRGWTVVSGLAYGIDAAAHQGALAGGGPTIGVLASGVDVTYPRTHESLLRRVLDAGLIVSEHPPGSAPHRGRFLVRNRIIAALTAGTLVVEAAARSGARNTAKHAGALGRAVMAVPGPITSTASIGCHQLLRDDPTVSLITGVDDVIEAVGAIGELAPRATGEMRRRDSLSPWHRSLLDAVPVSRPQQVQRIARTAGVPVDRALRGLTELAAADFAAESPQGWCLSETARRERRADRHSADDTLDLDWW